MKKGQICILFDGCPAIIVKKVERIWASYYMVNPLINTSFFNIGEIEQVLMDQVREPNS